MKAPESVDERLARLARSTVAILPPAGLEGRILRTLRSRGAGIWNGMLLSARKALWASAVACAAAIGVAAYADLDLSATTDAQVAGAIAPPVETAAAAELPDEL